MNNERTGKNENRQKGKKIRGCRPRPCSEFITTPISDRSKHILPQALPVELVLWLVEVLVPRLVEFPEPCVRQPVKPPGHQLVELLDHRPLELHELLIRQLAELLRQPVERLEPELLVPQDTVRLPWKKRKYEEWKKSTLGVRQLSQSDNLFICTDLICVALMYAV